MQRDPIIEHAALEEIQRTVCKKQMQISFRRSHYERRKDEERVAELEVVTHRAMAQIVASHTC